LKSKNGGGKGGSRALLKDRGALGFTNFVFVMVVTEPIGRPMTEKHNVNGTSGERRERRGNWGRSERY